MCSLFVLFAFVSYVSCLLLFVIWVVMLCCFCYWPLGCWLTTLVMKNWIELLLFGLLNNKINWTSSTIFAFQNYFYWLSSCNGALWSTFLYDRKDYMNGEVIRMWNWCFLVLFALNTEVNSMAFGHDSQDSHSAPSGCKTGMLSSWLQCLLGWLWINYAKERKKERIVEYFMMLFKHFDVVTEVNDETFYNVPSPVADPNVAPCEYKAWWSKFYRCLSMKIACCAFWDLSPVLICLFSCFI
jgi:hypothetical protein